MNFSALEVENTATPAVFVQALLTALRKGATHSLFHTGGYYAMPKHGSPEGKLSACAIGCMGIGNFIDGEDAEMNVIGGSLPRLLNLNPYSMTSYFLFQVATRISQHLGTYYVCIGYLKGLPFYDVLREYLGKIFCTPAVGETGIVYNLDDDFAEDTSIITLDALVIALNDMYKEGGYPLPEGDVRITVVAAALQQLLDKNVIFTDAKDAKNAYTNQSR